MKNRLQPSRTIVSVSRPCAPRQHQVPLALKLSSSTTSKQSTERRRYSSTVSQPPVSQPPHAEYLSFPGATKSAFSHALKFEQPSTHPALPTYRVVDQNGVVVDPNFKPDLSNEEVIKLYRDMLTTSIMDIIMFDAHRQGRISFYMVAAGEEATSVGSASALTKEDVIFLQYREQGVLMQRGFKLSEFMNQLFANKKDSGKGRNMPVHYGSRELNVVSCRLLVITDIYGYD
jgi:2-oxoisovalerate dehydrogenase E1 component alpha subunit